MLSAATLAAVTAYRRSLMSSIEDMPRMSSMEDMSVLSPIEDTDRMSSSKDRREMAADNFPSGSFYGRKANPAAARSITNWVKLGAAVRDARSRLGLTQAETASRAGVARSWLARVEAGHRTVELEPLLRLLQALELEMSLGPAVRIAPEGQPLTRRQLRQLEVAAERSRSMRHEGEND